LQALEAEIVTCRACPRLVTWRESSAARSRPAVRDAQYWARPVPGFGDVDARVLVVGLAPGAHGSNRTGRMFTGDRSGEWLFRALWRCGLCDRPAAVDRRDGLTLRGAFITAAARCAPPDNKPSPSELRSCRPYLCREMAVLTGTRVVVALGAVAWAAILSAMRDQGMHLPSPKPRFGHGTETTVGGLQLLASYHPSQQNTFTGRLTEPMFDAVWSRAMELVGG
jgi:uracil-DNA glycosylase family 4